MDKEIATTWISEAIAWTWLAEQNAMLAKSEGDAFIIVQDWETVESPVWEIMREALGVADDDWGFYDEYTTCSHCYNVIKTSPDHYGWVADFWLDLENGQVLCGDCTRSDFASEYLDSRIKAAENGDAVSCNLVKPEEHSFSLIAQGLENGLHHGQADSPQFVARELTRRGLDCMFTIRTSQFDVSFDVWARLHATWYWREYYTDSLELSRLQVQQVKAMLLKSESLSNWGNRSYLKSDLREYPTPAQRCEAGLKRISKHNLHFAKVQGDGSVLDYETGRIYND